jgi:protein-tyrosine kinase
VGIHSQEQIALLSDHDPSSAYSTAYHTLFYNIRFNWDSEQIPHYAILLATPATYAGQTTVAANIAIAAAQNGTPALLVDADLQNPSLQQRFGNSPQPGLGELLAPDGRKQPLSHYVSQTFIPDLFILSTGTDPRPPVESRRLFASGLAEVLKALRHFQQEQGNRPSLIIFNSPPVLASPDAILIGTQVDQTFLTIAAGHTTRRQARQAQEQLERARVKLAGTILLDM